MAPWIDFQRIKSEARFEPILARYNLKLEGTGSQRSILCPFHKETRPSCRVNLDKRIFHCFGCEAAGNILEFVAKMEGDGCSLQQAALIVAESCKIERADTPRSGKARKSVAEGPKAKGVPEVPLKPQRPVSEAPGASDEAVNPPLTFTLQLDPAHSYLAERGVSPEVVKLFGLGYCARGLMKGRICIPIRNERGELVAYAGRWPAEDLPEGEERYKLPPKFRKNLVLFNLDRIADTDHVAIVEGYWSVFRLHALGLPVVALMGRSMSEEQVALLLRAGIRSATLLMDGDEPGWQARASIASLLAADLFVRAPVLPLGEKPYTVSEEFLRAIGAR